MKAKGLNLVVVLLLLLSVILGACGGEDAETVEVVVDETEQLDDRDLSAVGSEEDAGGAPPDPDTGPKVEVTRAASLAVEVESLAEEAVGEGVAVDRADAAMPATTGSALPTPPAAAERDAETAAASLTLDQNSRLTAGEVDDNAGWDEYLLYLRNYNGAAVIRLDVSERHQIWVQDSQGGPVLGARIGIEANGQEVAVLRTHSDGRAYFFPRTLNAQSESYTVEVSVNGSSEHFVIDAGGSQREWFVTHPGADQLAQNARLDILFLIDATGSMADEINQLKANIRAISTQIDGLPSRPDVRFGMVSYRDRGDEYVTRVSDFTPDVEAFAGELAELFADGGGDYPEDLNEALSRAVHEPEWRVDDTVSLIFLVADAPPHLDYDQENHYAAELLEAAERGIKLYPIASSGLDGQGEYVFRQLAQISGGRFIFLTYGADGPGSSGTETDFEVSDYTVSSLDSLVVKIVEEELAFLQR